MPEVQKFLQDAWATTESTLAANDAERLRQEITRQVDGLRQEIARQKDAIVSGWKPVGLAAVILGGLFLAAEGCSHLANANRPRFGDIPGFWQFLGGLFGSLGALIFGLAFWLGIIVVLVMVIWQMTSLSVALARIAKLKTEIAHCEATRWKRPRSNTS